MKSKIALAFKKCKREKRAALITYTVAGDNNKNNSLKYDLNKITEYFNNFSNIECEKFKGFNIDLSNEKQLYQLIIKHNDMIDVLDVFSFSKKNNNSNQSEPNVERMYAVLNNGEYMLIQKYVFNKVFISIEDLEG